MKVIRFRFGFDFYQKFQRNQGFNWFFSFSVRFALDYGFFGLRINETETVFFLIFGLVVSRT